MIVQIYEILWKFVKYHNSSFVQRMTHLKILDFSRISTLEINRYSMWNNHKFYNILINFEIIVMIASPKYAE